MSSAMNKDGKKDPHVGGGMERGMMGGLKIGSVKNGEMISFACS